MRPMGMLKGFKDMKNMMAATPGLMDQASQLQANAGAMQAQAAQAQGIPAHGAAPTEVLPPELAAPIAGVDLATFAQISAGLAQFDYDQSRSVELAALRGIDPVSWQAALDGWNGRITSSPAVARQFNAFYTGRA
jgi:hypothetical protein